MNESIGLNETNYRQANLSSLSSLTWSKTEEGCSLNDSGYDYYRRTIHVRGLASLVLLNESGV